MPLEGFLSREDSNTINVSTHNLKGRRQSTGSGLQPVAIVGGELTLSDKNDVYELDTSNVYGESTYAESSPFKVKVDVLRRPVDVQCFAVVKEYDGTLDVSLQELAYRITTCGQASSGVVLGTAHTPAIYKADAEGVQLLQDPAVYRYVLTEREGKPLLDKLGRYLTVPQKLEVQPDESPIQMKLPIWLEHHQLHTAQAELEVDTEHTPMVSLSKDIPCDIRNVITAEEVPEDTHSASNPINLYLKLRDVDGINSEAALKESKSLGTIWRECAKATLHNMEQFAASYKELTRSVWIQIPLIPQWHTTPECGQVLESSDFLDVWFCADKAEFESLDRINEMQPIQLTNCTLEGSKSSNYCLNSVSAFGIITPRRLYTHIATSNKEYDGTTVVPFLITFGSEPDFKPFEADVLSIDATKIEIHSANKNVGSYAITQKVKPQFIGYAANRYQAMPSIYSQNVCNIEPRKCQVYIKALYYHRPTNHIEVKGYITRQVAGDDIVIDISALRYELSGDLISIAQLEQMLKNAKLSWSQASYYDVATLQNTAEGLKLSNGQLINITGAKLSGNDANNYEITNIGTTHKVPFYIINVH